MEIRRPKSNARLFSAFVIATLLLFCLSAMSQAFMATEQIDPSAINSKYQDRLVMLRGPYCGQELKFDDKGMLVSRSRPGDWQACQGMRIRHVQAKDRKLTISAERVRLSYDCAAGGSREVPETASDGPNRQEVTIAVQLPPQASDQAVMELMDKLFRLSTPAPHEVFGSDAGGVFHVGNGVTAPVAIFSPDPDYSQKARAARYKGRVVLIVIVGPDGLVHNVRLARALGNDLDEKAVEKVKTWRFKPATKCGTPVAVEVSVEVRFDLY